MNLFFYGASKSVTGANYLLESGKTRILVDCGLSQAGSFAEKQNFEPFPYDPKAIDALFVTHAHIDHTGRIPKLFKEGFRGKIYSTKPTMDFAEALLLDSEHILGEEAERQNQPPLYSTEDLEGALGLWEGKEYKEKIKVGEFEAELHDAGHILGSASVRISAEGRSIVFSGDLGNYPAPIINPTEPMPEADYCAIESTYGDRIHEDESKRRDNLEDVVEDVVRSKGTLMIPAFAMERTQDLLYNLNQLVEEGRIPRVPVFLDSPLAIEITSVYKKYERYFNPDTKGVISSGDDILNFPGLRLTLTTEESKSINAVPPPKIVIAGSGMSQGGRILHHERRYLPDASSAILFVGYQTAGSLGRRIMEGAKVVKIFGEEIPVRAKVRNISSYSAHADQPKLLAWLYPRRMELKKVFVIQGEEEASVALAQKIRDELAVAAEIPEIGKKIVI